MYNKRCDHAVEILLIITKSTLSIRDCIVGTDLCIPTGDPRCQSDVNFKRASTVHAAIGNDWHCDTVVTTLPVASPGLNATSSTV